MYHEVTPAMIRRRRLNIIVGIVALVLVVVVACFAGLATQESLRQQGAASLRDTILSAAVQCCAIEGAYPQTLQYLVDNYGLAINDEDYVITYEAFASNVMPSVVVVPR